MSLKEKKEQEKQLKAQIRQKDNEKKEELISVIFNYPEIWNKASPDFRDRQLQAVKWEEISNIMNMSIKDTKTMWKYLKDQFRTNFHAVSKKKSGQEYIEEQDMQLIKWPFFKQLMFLKDVVCRRETTCNLAYNDEDGEAADKILKSIGLNNEEDHNEAVEEEENEGSTCASFAPSTSAGSSTSARPSTSAGPSTSDGPPTSAGPSTSTNITLDTSKSSRKTKRKAETDPKEIADKITKEISKIDGYLEASIAHQCQNNVEKRPQTFCKYLAQLLSGVPEEMQLDCEMDLVGVVRGYLKRKSNSEVVNNEK